MIKTKNIFLLIIGIICSTTLCWAQPVKKETTSESLPPAVAFVMELQSKLATGNMDEAIAYFDNIPAELENDLGLKALLGALYYSNGDIDLAIEIGKEITSINPMDIEGLELLYKCYKEKKISSEYSKIEKKLLSIDPNNATVNLHKAGELMLVKKWKPARNLYLRVLKGDPENVDANFGYAKTSYFLYDTKAARTYLNKVIELDPYYSEAYSFLGKLEYEDENIYNAIDFTLKALEIAPTNYNYLIDLGTYYSRLGKNDEAIAAWTEASKVDPTYFLAYVNLAGIYDNTNNFDKALENYHKVIKTNPNYYYAYESIAILEYHAKNYENAINYFLTAYSYNQSYSYTLMAAACFYKLKKPLDAKKLLAAQMKLIPNKKSTEFELVRFFHDSYNSNAEYNLLRKIDAEDNSNTKGKMLFYMGLYNEIFSSTTIAKEYYMKVTNLEAPMFFEYRIAEWGLEEL